MQANNFSIEQVRQFWDGVASPYDRINEKMDWTHTERFETMRIFCRRLRALLC